MSHSLWEFNLLPYIMEWSNHPYDTYEISLWLLKHYCDVHTVDPHRVEEYYQRFSQEVYNEPWARPSYLKKRKFAKWLTKQR